MKKILTLQDITSSSWGERFHEAFGANLKSVFLHGNCLYEGFDALHESWQVSLILASDKPSELQSAHAIAREMSKDNLKFGYFFTEEFLRSKSNIYPLEFLHISQKNVPLFGNAPLAGFVPNADALQAECKRELENRKLQLLREFSRIQAGISPMDFFIEAYEEIYPILYGIAYLQTKGYPQNRAEIAQAFPAFEVQEPALDYKQNVERADQFFASLDQLIQSL